jgi:hypothetical protein
MIDQLVLVLNLLETTGLCHEAAKHCLGVYEGMSPEQVWLAFAPEVWRQARIILSSNGDLRGYSALIVEAERHALVALDADIKERMKSFDPGAPPLVLASFNHPAPPGEFLHVVVRTGEKEWDAVWRASPLVSAQVGNA